MSRYRSLPRQYGKALGILWRADRFESEMHADVSAWGAPSECHDSVSSGEARRRREARRHAEAVAGVPLRVLLARAARLVPPAALRRAEARVSEPRHPWFD